MKMKFKVKALINFYDLEENKHRVIGEVFECFKTRCDYLLEHKAIEIVEEPKKEIKEDTKVVCEDKEVKKLFEEPKPKKKKSSKK